MRNAISGKRFSRYPGLMRSSLWTAEAATPRWKIRRAFTDKIFQRGWTGYVDQKNFAVDKASHDWIFSRDADERSSPELCSEIRELALKGLGRPGYRIPRVAFFMGRWIRHGDWYPDYQLRLFDRRCARWGRGPRARIRADAGKAGPPAGGNTALHLSKPFGLPAPSRNLFESRCLRLPAERKMRVPLQPVGQPDGGFRPVLYCEARIPGRHSGIRSRRDGAQFPVFKYAKLFELQRKEGVQKSE